MGEGAVARLVDHRLAGARLQLVDQVMSEFAAHQQAAEGAGAADGSASGLGAAALGLGQVGKIRSMAFTGVHHQHAHAARAIQQRLDRRDRRAQAADVHAGLVGVSAQRAEVALHVDHQQRRMLEEQRVRRQAHSANSLHTAAAMPSTMSWASRWPFAALEPLAEDSTPEGGTHSVRVGYMS